MIPRKKTIEPTCTWAVDPGTNSGLCIFINKKPVALFAVECRSYTGILRSLAKQHVFERYGRPTEVIIEDQYHGNKAMWSSVLSVIKSRAWWEAIGDTQQCSIYIVNPSKWKKLFAIPKGKDRKRLSKARAQHLPFNLVGKLTNDTAESVLIGLFHYDYTVKD